MKRILFAFIMLFSVIGINNINAQTYVYRSTGYYQRLTGQYWSARQPSNINITINYTTDEIIVYSKRYQHYRIYSTIESGHYDSDGDYVTRFGFYDQDGDRGELDLIVRRNGNSQIYIRFNDIEWAYDVIRQ